MKVFNQTNSNVNYEKESGKPSTWDYLLKQEDKLKASQ